MPILSQEIKKHWLLKMRKMQYLMFFNMVEKIKNKALSMSYYLI